jgi:hypothetical protein
MATQINAVQAAKQVAQFIAKLTREGLAKDRTITRLEAKLEAQAGRAATRGTKAPAAKKAAPARGAAKNAKLNGKAKGRRAAAAEEEEEEAPVRRVKKGVAKKTAGVAKKGPATKRVAAKAAKGGKILKTGKKAKSADFLL